MLKTPKNRQELLQHSINNKNSRNKNNLSGPNTEKYNLGGTNPNTQNKQEIVETF